MALNVHALLSLIGASAGLRKYPRNLHSRLVDSLFRHRTGWLIKITTTIEMLQ